MFQFTHPGKGATSLTASASARFFCFNSRTLGRVRPVCRSTAPNDQDVSIHAPWEGCDKEDRGVVKDELTVSIHAPWEGCDGSRHYLGNINLCFNSRTLGRVRREHHKPSYLPCSFNSRTLGRVRLIGLSHAQRYIKVSIHAPWEGCDGYISRRTPISPRFQFTHPGKGATVWCKVAYYRADKQA